LTATPYALTLKPGAIISTTVASNPALSGINLSTGTGLSGTSYNGKGVYGISSIGEGVYGLSSSGSGAYGYSNTGKGVEGYSLNNHGIQGTTSGSASYAGVYGSSTTINGNGLIGEANTGDGAYGVWGRSTSGVGVVGYGGSYGLIGSGGTGVFGQSNDTDGIGVLGSTDFGSNGPNARGVYGSSYNGTGVYGAASGVSGRAGAFAIYNTANTNNALYAETNGSGNAIYAYTTGTSRAGRFEIHNNSSSANALFALTNGSGNALVASNLGTGRAGVFAGDVDIVGTLSKSAGSFKIDDPIDPANKYLYHSFVESPDMLNIYRGHVTLDASGEGVVELPRWFEALNRDFDYQLTPIGVAMPNLYIAEEIKGDRSGRPYFIIAGGKAGMKVSWQVTGVRHDDYANAHRIPVEEDKPANERGTYLHPTEHGLPETLGVGFEEMHRQAPQPTHR
jgi:hypothetical protein